MMWFFIILGLMILGCMVMAVKDEKKYGYGKRRMRKKKKRFIRRIIENNPYPRWS